MSGNGDFYRDNDYEFEFYVDEKRTADGVRIPATGLIGLSGWASASDGGAEIHADVKVAATERPSRPGYYFGIINGDKITLRMLASASDDNTPAYLRFADTAQNINISRPRRRYLVRRDD